MFSLLFLPIVSHIIMQAPLREALTTVNADRLITPRVVVARAGQPEEALFRSFLLEDSPAASYAAWLETVLRNASEMSGPA